MKSKNSRSKQEPKQPADFTNLYAIELAQNQCPIVYSKEYNISFFGVEKVHPFDSKKWGRVFKFLTGLI